MQLVQACSATWPTNGAANMDFFGIESYKSSLINILFSDNICSFTELMIKRRYE